MTPGGLTIEEAIHDFEDRGYRGEFVIGVGGFLECTACSARLRPQDVSLESMRRVEGPSDPADMALIGALRCPECGVRGTTAVPYGSLSTAESARVLRELHDERRSATRPDRSTDASLIRDSGWLLGPDDPPS